MTNKLAVDKNRRQPGFGKKRKEEEMGGKDSWIVLSSPWFDVHISSAGMVFMTLQAVYIMDTEEMFHANNLRFKCE